MNVVIPGKPMSLFRFENNVIDGGSGGHLDMNFQVPKSIISVTIRNERINFRAESSAIQSILTGHSGHIRLGVCRLCHRHLHVFSDDGLPPGEGEITNELIVGCVLSA